MRFSLSDDAWRTREHKAKILSTRLNVPPLHKTLIIYIFCRKLFVLCLCRQFWNEKNINKMHLTVHARKNIFLNLTWFIFFSDTFFCFKSATQLFYHSFILFLYHKMRKHFHSSDYLIINEAKVKEPFIKKNGIGQTVEARRDYSREDFKCNWVWKVIHVLKMDCVSIFSMCAVFIHSFFNIHEQLGAKTNITVYFWISLCLIHRSFIRTFGVLNNNVIFSMNTFIHFCLARLVVAYIEQLLFSI